MNRGPVDHPLKDEVGNHIGGVLAVFLFRESNAVVGDYGFRYFRNNRKSGDSRLGSKESSRFGIKKITVFPRSWQDRKFARKAEKAMWMGSRFRSTYFKIIDWNAIRTGWLFNLPSTNCRWKKKDNGREGSRWCRMIGLIGIGGKPRSETFIFLVWVTDHVTRGIAYGWKIRRAKIA